MYMLYMLKLLAYTSMLLYSRQKIYQRICRSRVCKPARKSPAWLSPRHCRRAIVIRAFVAIPNDNSNISQHFNNVLIMHCLQLISLNSFKLLRAATRTSDRRTQARTCTRTRRIRQCTSRRCDRVHQRSCLQQTTQANDQVDLLQKRS